MVVVEVVEVVDLQEEINNNRLPSNNIEKVRMRYNFEQVPKKKVGIVCLAYNPY